MGYNLDGQTVNNRNRTRTVSTPPSSHNQPRNHDLAYILTNNSLIILKKAYTRVDHNGPCYLVLVIIVSILERGE